MSEFDWSTYTRAPVLDVPTAVALGHALLSAAPKQAPEPVKTAARSMRRDVGELQKAWRTALPEKTQDPRRIDSRYDGAWSALRDRLVATSSLSADEHQADIGRAEEIVEILFPTGADFLKLPYVKQWAESEKRIATVNERGLRKDIERLAGAPYWAQIEGLHKLYGDVLGITKGKESVPAATKLLDPLRGAQRSIANYLLQVAAFAANDESFVVQAKRALAPVDATREAIAKRIPGAEPPSSPVPPVTPETPLPPEPMA
jgi:hypothetical protein